MQQKHIGELYPTRDGKYNYKVIDYTDNEHVTVELQNPDNPYTRTVSLQRLKKGLSYPGAEVQISANTRLANKKVLDNCRSKYLGKSFRINNGRIIKVIQYENAHCITIEYQDTYERFNKTSYQLKNMIKEELS